MIKADWPFRNNINSWRDASSISYSIEDGIAHAIAIFDWTENLSSKLFVGWYESHLAFY